MDSCNKIQQEADVLRGNIDVVDVYDGSAKRRPNAITEESVVDNKIEFSDLSIVLSSFLLQAVKLTHSLPPRAVRQGSQNVRRGLLPSYLREKATLHVRRCLGMVISCQAV